MLEAESLLASVGHADWARVEDAPIALLRSGAYRDRRQWTATAIVLAQARLLGRLDARGAFATLSPILSDGGLELLPARWRARAAVLWALIAEAPGSPLEPTGKRSTLWRCASVLVEVAGDADLRVLLALARRGGGLDLPPRILSTFSEGSVPAWGAATAAVTRCLAYEVGAAYATRVCDRHLHHRVGLRLARSVGFHAAEARLLLAAAEGPSGARRADSLRALARDALVRGGIRAPWLEARLRHIER